MTDSLTKALQTSNDYLAARKAFAAVADSNDWLKGNDNYIGRIGEMAAMIYLREKHGLMVTNARGEHANKSRKAVDIKVGDTWWSVKCVSDESTSMRTSPYKANESKEESDAWIWPPLIIIRIEYLHQDELKITGVAYPRGLQAATKEVGKPGPKQQRALATKDRFKNREPIPGLAEFFSCDLLGGITID
jgi:hypothetical protein